MRRLFVFVACIAILLCSVFSVGAIGNNTASLDVYSSLQFDYFAVAGGNTPRMVEWPFSCVSVGTDNIYALGAYLSDSGSTQDVLDVGVQCQRSNSGYNVYGYLDFLNINGSSGTQLFQVYGHDMVVDMNKIRGAGGVKLASSSEGGYFAWLIDKIQISGSYYIPYYHDDGSFSLSFTDFSQTWGWDSSTAILGDLIYEAMSGKTYYDDIMCFREITVSLFLRPNFDSPTYDGMISMGYSELLPTSATNTPRNVQNWLNSNPAYAGDMVKPSPDVPDAPSDDTDNIGTWLANVVSSFMKAEIFPGLSFERVVYVVVVIGLLLWFIKLVS